MEFTKEERRNGWMVGAAMFVLPGMIAGMVVAGLVNLVIYLLIFQWFNLPEDVLFTGAMYLDIPIMFGVATWVGVAIGKLRMQKERERRLQGNTGTEKV